MESPQTKNSSSEIQNISQEPSQQISSDVHGDSEPEMQRPEPSRERKESVSQQKPFSPFVAQTLEVRGDQGIFPYAAVYNEKHHIIIACPRDKSVQFYDSTTLQPSEGIETERLEGIVFGMSFWPETETCILGCTNGHIYTYNLLRKTLQKVQQVQKFIISIAFLNSNHYVFGVSGSGQLSVGNLENKDLLHFPLQGGNARYLENVTKRSLLLTILANGSMQIFRTGQLPRLPLLHSVNHDKNHGYSAFKKIQSLTIGRKEYIITTGSDHQIEIWQFTKGKMKRIKAIQTEEHVVDVAYLEEYKMLVTTHESEFTKFWRFPSGRFESQIGLERNRCQAILMKDKNRLGISNGYNNYVRIVKLHP